ncbi:trihelix transcription factor ASR3-like [Malania oleifera]|uniref:trihelix transcription factor ASR3-like n=1 Tax=Malania oleifera TaxID=397392 RepID=UPI0025ADFC74|nr:trihelix transcription factor ASR3-like [Malania oleifera]
MAQKAKDAQENAYSISDGVERQQVPGESTDDRNKALRHPRWTRQEMFVLIQGKKVIENGVKGEAESFWPMRNDLRKERKLLGFFNREVYDALDGKTFNVAAIPLTLVKVVANANNENEIEIVEEEEEDETETTFDSSRNAAIDDSMFSNFEHAGQEDVGGIPEEENMGTESPTKTDPT